MTKTIRAIRTPKAQKLFVRQKLKAMQKKSESLFRQFCNLMSPTKIMAAQFGNKRAEKSAQHSSVVVLGCRSIG